VFLQGKFSGGNVIFPSALIQKRGRVRNVFGVSPVDYPAREPGQNLPGVILDPEDFGPSFLGGGLSDLSRVTFPEHPEAGFAQQFLLSYGFIFFWL